MILDDKQRQDLLNELEALRRDRKTMDANPVKDPDIRDYAACGTMISAAVHALDESIPNGQKRRTEVAAKLLLIGVVELNAWLRAKGFDMSEVSNPQADKQLAADEMLEHLGYTYDSATKKWSPPPICEDDDTTIILTLPAALAKALRGVDVRAVLEEGARTLGADAVKRATNRFLGWKLPDGFTPDCFVSFDKERAKANHSWPTGTNLFSFDQAREMFAHALAVTGEDIQKTVRNAHLPYPVGPAKGDSSHDLYTDADQDRPEIICDSTGQVVLGMCKVCGRAEAELDGPCPGDGSEPTGSYTNQDGPAAFQEGLQVLDEAYAEREVKTDRTLALEGLEEYIRNSDGITVGVPSELAFALKRQLTTDAPFEVIKVVPAFPDTDAGKRYVLGFAFTPKGEVVLIYKIKGMDHLVNKFNGLGGRMEGDEYPVDTMVREFLEEARVYTTREQWRIVAPVQFAAKRGGYILTAQLTQAQADFIRIQRPVTEEGTVCLIDTNTTALVGGNFMPNLAWMVGMCLDPEQPELRADYTAVRSPS